MLQKASLSNPPSRLLSEITYYSTSKVRSSTVNIDVEEYTLSDADKKKLSKNCDQNYLNKLAEFLTHHNMCSEANVRSVMKQATALYSGKGVFYKWWPEGHQWFMEGIRVTPLTDLVQVLLDAKEWENTYGRDKGNGWLLDHPLKKMLIFQQFCLNNPEFMDSDLKLGAWLAEEEEGSDEDEDIENIPVYQSEREVTGNLSELLESAGTMTPSKKSPSKSPSAKKSRTPVKSPRKGGDPAMLPFVVKQATPEKTPQKKSAKDILREKAAAKAAASKNKSETAATKSPKKSQREILREKAASKMKAPAKSKKDLLKEKVAMKKSQSSPKVPKKSVREQLLAKVATKQSESTIGDYEYGEIVDVDWGGTGEWYEAEIKKLIPSGKGQFGICDSYDVRFLEGGEYGEVKSRWIKRRGQ